MTFPAVTPPLLLCPPCLTGWPSERARRRGQTAGQTVIAPLLWSWRPQELFYVARCERCGWAERFALEQVRAILAIVQASRGQAKRPGRREEP